MSDQDVNSPPPSTTEHDRGASQMREVEERGPDSDQVKKQSEVFFDIGSRVTRAEHIQAYARDPERDPLYRPLRIYTRDPTSALAEGAIATVKIPYEPLKEPGPRGKLFHVIETEDDAKAQVVLDAPNVLISNGVDPSPANRHFHQQMLYAVCTSVYSAFRMALGRHVAWGFEDWARSGTDDLQLRIVPHVPNLRNAYYDREAGALFFGYHKAMPEEVTGDMLPGLYYRCLSHDIIAHEVTHALLDGLRSHFMFPSDLEVLAFHEAFADLVAIFQHFSYGEMLRSAIRRSRGHLKYSTLLTDLATEFGHTTGKGRALRTAIDQPDDPTKIKRYDPGCRDKYELGSVLVSAIFDAFSTIYERKTQRYVKLATGGSGILPLGDMPDDLIEVLAGKAARLASQFLGLCIRAIDYCPPVDLNFGDYLRALITADFNLVPDDPYGYRDAIIDAFRRRGIFPEGVLHLSQDELRWRSPSRKLERVVELDFAHLQFTGDPMQAAGEIELRRQATVLGREIGKKQVLEEFGLVPESVGVAMPCIESIRSSRRAGPDGQILFDLVAEVTQKRIVDVNGRKVDLYGGSTIIIDPLGDIRYVISKSVAREDRLKQQQEFVNTSQGLGLWQEREGRYVPAANVFQLLHESA